MKAFFLSLFDSAVGTRTNIPKPQCWQHHRAAIGPIYPHVCRHFGTHQAISRIGCPRHYLILFLSYRKPEIRRNQDKFFSLREGPQCQKELSYASEFSASRQPLIAANNALQFIILSTDPTTWITMAPVPYALNITD